MSDSDSGVWIAPRGEPFPSPRERPSGNWQRLGDVLPVVDVSDISIDPTPPKEREPDETREK